MPWRNGEKGHILIPQFSSDSNAYVVDDGIVSYKVLLTDTGTKNLFDGEIMTQQYLQSKTLEEILQENSLAAGLNSSEQEEGKYKRYEKYAYYIQSPFLGEKGSKIRISGLVRIEAKYDTIEILDGGLDILYNQTSVDADRFNVFRDIDLATSSLSDDVEYKIGAPPLGRNIIETSQDEIGIAFTSDVNTQYDGYLILIEFIKDAPPDLIFLRRDNAPQYGFKAPASDMVVTQKLHFFDVNREPTGTQAHAVYQAPTSGYTKADGNDGYVPNATGSPITLIPKNLII